MSLDENTPAIQSIPPETMLCEAARIMERDSVGALLICEEAGGLIQGILTDRDIVKQIAGGLDPEQTSVAAFLEQPVTTLPEGASRREITREMRIHGIRRIPLVDREGRVTRLVSLDDLLMELGEEMFDIGHAIRAELHHEAPDPDPDE